MAVTVLRKTIGKKLDWQSRLHSSGWFEVRRDYERDDIDVLAANAERARPGKLLRKPNGVEERFEFYLGRSGEAYAFPDDETAAAQAQLRQESIELAEGKLEATASPSAEQLSRWLADAGFEPATDKDNNLRLTLKRPGCDGAVRIERGEGRLRFLLPLGNWPRLSPASEQAMRALAEFVNAHVRLARLAVSCDSDARRFEAQVEWTGLPFVEDAAHERLWREAAPLSVKALELALRQLGLELPLLADHPEVAEVMLARCE